MKSIDIQIHDYRRFLSSCLQVFVGTFRGRGTLSAPVQRQSEQAMPGKRRFGITRSSVKEEEAARQSSPDSDAPCDGMLHPYLLSMQSVNAIAIQSMRACRLDKWIMFCVK